MDGERVSAIYRAHELNVHLAALTRFHATETILGRSQSHSLRLVHVLPLATHIVTLIAFVSYAVLGCCGHHGHAVEYPDRGSSHAACSGSHMHRAEMHRAEISRAGLASAHASDGHCHQTDASPASDNSCPCDDSPNCQVSTCAYVDDGYKWAWANSGLARSGHGVRMRLDSASSLAARDADSTAEASYAHYRTSVTLYRPPLQTWQV